MIDKILNGLAMSLFFSTVILFIGWIFSNISGWFWFIALILFVFVNELTE